MRNQALKVADKCLRLYEAAGDPDGMMDAITMKLRLVGLDQRTPVPKAPKPGKPERPAAPTLAEVSIAQNPKPDTTTASGSVQP